jgi:hypothetical protein
VRDNIMPLPYKEPSQTLLTLLEKIGEEARRFAATADMKVSDMSAQAPVGTTLALLERQLKIMSAVQARMHYSMKQELKLLKAIIRDHTPDSYTYEPDAETPAGPRAKRGDYALVEVIPVSDPNAATMSQRVVQYQAALQLSQQAPQIYNLPRLHRQMLEVLGIKHADKIVELPEDKRPEDPVTENMNVLRAKPIKAFRVPRPRGAHRGAPSVHAGPEDHGIHRPEPDGPADDGCTHGAHRPSTLGSHTGLRLRSPWACRFRRWTRTRPRRSTPMTRRSWPRCWPQRLNAP